MDAQELAKLIDKVEKESPKCYNCTLLLEKLLEVVKQKTSDNGEVEMKTIIIWDSCGETSLKFFILDGDFSHLDNVYINSADKEKEKELNSLIHDEDGFFIPIIYETFPLVDLRDNYKVIVCGFIP